MFLNQLSIKAERGSNCYTLTKWLTYESEDSQIWSVSIGFVTDFASIPRMLKGFVDDNDPRIREAAVLHDFLYSICVTGRRKADLLFLEAMKSLEAPWFIRYPVYLSVRLFGGSHWNS